ncbi:Regulator of protease activity HflC, stomatin/prohibitin superfamily [Carnobacterium alterfunditum]|uniref:Regulator of protease activity HflC, stomatin/prohibitin superfamily n=1 Tax=Carnobacterium alterfunditum TaxID=28230 RepID=A0A1N6EW38_9LACT|nr:SPFH domain-containing protein [Carnobacterium alterfunditum]SIN87206.1 Regulator of protease activity HflC, stomatin/prohibitin superfamily [Carnobacterium alterfunditum]
MSYKAIKNLVISLILAIVLVFGFLLFVEKVDEGKVAVVYSPSGGSKEVLSAGWHLIGLMEKTTEYPIRVQTMKNSVSVSTTDGKKLKMSVRYQMQVDKKKVLNIFKELGSQNVEDIQEGYLYNKLYKSSRDVVSSYTVLDIYGSKSGEASQAITDKFAEEVKDMGFIITDVTLGTPEADAETQKSIDARVKASQENELKKTQIENAKLDSEQKRIVAEGEAAAGIIQAEGEAKANEVLQQSISPELLQKEYIEKWDGKEPLVKGEGTSAIINVPEQETEKKE